MLIKGDSKYLIREAFLTVLPAQLLAALVPFLSSIINGLVIGSFCSENAIAVIGFVAPVVYFLSAVKTLFSMGGGITAGNYMGQGWLSKVNETYCLCVKTLFLFGLALTAAGLLFTGGIVSWLTAGSGQIDGTAGYLRGLSVGFVPCLLIPFLTSVLQLAGESKRVVFSSVFNAVLNLIFDILAVKVLHAGIPGIGLATSLSQYFTVVYLLISLRRTGFVKFSLAPSDLRILKNVFSCGLASGLLLFFEAIRNSILIQQSLLVGGMTASAATSAIMASSGLLDFVSVGFLVSVSAVAGLYAGEENEEALSMTVRWGMTAGGLSGLGAGLLFFIFAAPVAGAFGVGGDALPYAVICFRMYAVYIILVLPFEIILTAYQCFKRVKLTIVLIFFRVIVASVSAIFLFSMLFGVPGLWLCYPASAVFSWLLVFAVSAYQSKKQGRKKFSLLWYDGSKTFKDSENRFVFSENEIPAAMDGVESFCLRNQIDKKTASVCRLLTEENITTLLEHGISVRKRRLSINVFIGTDGEKTRLVFQDNSAPFHPLERFRVYEKEEESLVKDASIQIVKSLSRGISYQFSFGMNILMIDLYRKE